MVSANSSAGSSARASLLVSRGLRPWGQRACEGLRFASGPRRLRPAPALQETGPGRSRHCSGVMGGTRASRRIYEGLSRSFLGWGGVFLALPCCMQDLFPNQRSNPCPGQWKRRVLTTGPPGKSLHRVLMENAAPLSLGSLGRVCQTEQRPLLPSAGRTPLAWAPWRAGLRIPAWTAQVGAGSGIRDGTFTTDPAVGGRAGPGNRRGAAPEPGARPGLPGSSSGGVLGGR